MKERPILFSAQMVEAILDDRKTQTRRVVKPQPVFVAAPNVPFKTEDADPNGIIRCPHGKPGDRLWVRETFAPMIGGGYVYAADYTAERLKAPGGSGFWKPSIHMPRSASRITLEITGVRIERLNDISEDDAIAEGVDVKMDAVMTAAQCRGKAGTAAQLEYWHLWESIHGKGSWDANPFVWVVEFNRVTA